jgi:hypothetical protein
MLIMSRYAENAHNLEVTPSVSVRGMRRVEILSLDRDITAIDTGRVGVNICDYVPATP